jgi:pilus assembly protein CpaE
MPELSVVIVATDNEQRTVLRVLVDGTNSARAVQTFASLPVAATDPVAHRIRAANSDVILIDIPSDNDGLALRTIELLHQEMPDVALFAIGNLNQPQVIVKAMRVGAREFLERPTTTKDLLEAFSRLERARRVRQESARGKIYSVINAKGGSGATTVAVNLAIALQSAHGQSALVDLAPLGHAALHLNLKPHFTVANAIHNMKRMDGSLLESFMTRHTGGLQLLAGNEVPALTDSPVPEFDTLLSLLEKRYRYVVVDLSTRFDAASRRVANHSETVLLVACSDVASLWSAARVQEYLGETGGREQVRLVLNRFRKVPGFSEGDAEAAVGAKLLWRVPNQYFAISGAIDRGTPLTSQGSSEIARCFAGLAHELTRNDDDVKRATWSLFKTV